MARTAEKLKPAEFKLTTDANGLQGLTSSQYRFATLKFSGLSNADAYRAAYNCQDAPDQVVWSDAAALANHPLVVTKIRELRESTDRQTTLAVALSRNFVLNGLMRLATAAEKESVQLGALQTLGKTVGIDLFRETVIHETRARTVADVEEELRDKLEQLRTGLTIEGSANMHSVQGDKPKDRRRKPKP